MYKEVELSEEMQSRLKNLRNHGFSKIYSNINKSLFRDDLDPEQVIRLITLTFSGYENEVINRLKGENLSTLDMETFWDDFHEFLAALKKVYYK